VVGLFGWVGWLDCWVGLGGWIAWLGWVVGWLESADEDVVVERA